MKTFKQFMTEMPHVIAEPHRFMAPQVIKKGENSSGIITKKLGSSRTHNYYTVHLKEAKPHHFIAIQATDRRGNLHYDIDGTGDLKKKTFHAKLARGTSQKAGGYHGVITHLISKGHIKEWHSDIAHSRGSVHAYKQLADHPRLHVSLTNAHTGDTKEVNGSNINRFYRGGGNMEARFVVRKR